MGTIDILNIIYTSFHYNKEKPKQKSSDSNLFFSTIN